MRPTALPEKNMADTKVEGKGEGNVQTCTLKIPFVCDRNLRCKLMVYTYSDASFTAPYHGQVVAVQEKNL